MSHLPDPLTSSSRSRIIRVRHGMMASRRGATDTAGVAEPVHGQSAELPVGIFETDAAGGYLWVNRRWSEMTGLSLERATGRGWLAAVHPDDRARVETDWYGAVHAGRGSALEWRAITSREHVTWVAGEAVPNRDERGR